MWYNTVGNIKQLMLKSITQLITSTLLWVLYEFAPTILAMFMIFVLLAGYLLFVNIESQPVIMDSVPTLVQPVTSP